MMTPAENERFFRSALLPTQCIFKVVFPKRVFAAGVENIKLQIDIEIPFIRSHPFLINLFKQHSAARLKEVIRKHFTSIAIYYCAPVYLILIKEVPASQPAS